MNAKVLTYSADERTYKVWSMADPSRMLFQLADTAIDEIKISPGIMLVIYNRVADHVPLKVVNIEDGATLRQFNHPLHRTRKIDFIEQFNEKLLVKQEGEPLQIIDVHTHSLVSVATTDFLTPAAFIFLYDKQLFLTFRNRYVHVWNFRGEMVTAFDDHTLWHPDTNTNNIYITSTQDYIVSYCRRSDTDSGAGGGVHISSILTGKCIARLADGAPLPELQDVTSLFYNEERHELYIGNKQGILTVWAQ